MLLHRGTSQPHRLGALRALLSGILVVLPACGDASSASTPKGPSDVEPTSADFVAFESNFLGYTQWKSFVLPPSGAPSKGPHTGNGATVYINRLPPSGSREFPVGTIIVKEMLDGPPDERQVFAMVKRGGTYNATGAVGWEWFELRPLPSGGVKKVWRGFGPPAGEKYGGDSGGGCNECHGPARANDSVLSPPLQLSGL